ncbi:MAG TPA: MFS transporter [Nocardioidaceae bacterium]|nr:MFS transporter [Nocardioidaceae bacterium]
MITTYRRVLGVPGAFAMSLSGLVGRLPISMIGLGLVVLISGETGSYSLAGAVSASYIVGNAAMSVVVARLMDQRGQAPVILVGLAVSMVSLVLTMVAVEARWPSPVPHLLAALVGAGLPLVGAAVRARWSYLLEDKALLQTAFALEAVVDEVVFVVGPTLVTVLATAVHPLAGLTTAIVAATVGTLAFVALRSTEPPPAGKHSRGDSAQPMGWPVLGPLALAAVCMGILFGACEVATVAFADERDNKAVSGVLLAIWSLGSLLSGLVVGTIRWKASTAVRFQWSLFALAALLLPLPFLDSLWLLGAALFLAGWCISPALIAAVSRIEETVPSSRRTEGMAVFSTGLMAGVAPGAALVGWVVDRYGASAGYWVPTAAGFIGALLAFATSFLGRPPAPLEVDGEAVEVEPVRQR